MRNKVKISRNHLESLLKKKTKEITEANTDIAHLQQSCEQLKKDVQLWKAKSDNLALKCTKLAGLLRKYLAENEIVNQTEKAKTKERPSLKRKLVNTAESEDPPPLQKKLKEAPSDIDIKEEDEHRCNKVPNANAIFSLENAESTSAKVSEEVPNLPVATSADYNQPKPTLTVSQTQKGVEVLLEYTNNFSHSHITQYELYAFNNSQESRSWKKLGEIKAIKLPIKVTLSQGHNPGTSYYFAVRAKTGDDIVGPFSDIQKMCLK